MSKHELQFDEEAHVYTVDGRRMPSVTEIIRKTLPGWEASEWYMQRGRALHHGCALLDLGKKLAPVDVEIAQRIEAWQKFVRDANVQKFLQVEARHHSRRYQFAGTLDRVLEIDNAPVLCDIKSSLSPQVLVQLGGYSILLPLRYAGAVAVELRGDATYRAKWFTKRELEHGSYVFLAALTIHNFKVAHNLKEASPCHLPILQTNS